MSVFAQLDDAQASAERSNSRLETGFVPEHRCVDPADLDALWVAAQADLSRHGPTGVALHAVLLNWARQPLPAHEALLVGYKTSLRSTYEAALATAMAAGAFDCLFFNARGELTEGARSNVIVKLQGQWFIPPLSFGVLPGVMRAAVLAGAGTEAVMEALTEALTKALASDADRGPDGALAGLTPGTVIERVLRREDLALAEDWQVCNALRGCLRARLAEPLTDDPVDG